MSDDRLTLLANAPADLPVLSALMQDAIVRAGDIGWDSRQRRLVLLASRYRWESSVKTRARTALRIESVLKVQRQNWPADPDTALALLTIAGGDDHITLAFAGSASLRAEVECIDVVLEDMSPAWAVQHRPDHN